ncbi:heterokaryon incompatibility protein-domain-containing protein [Aspergillus cavernicola]|uniref:Heterokaryon incompatibility protein-domain-containing protein n=1 Tax=Aspergillus cavernicola TaxID=176166 RepID=A0ABR4HQS5_9EURO
MWPIKTWFSSKPGNPAPSQKGINAEASKNIFTRLSNSQKSFRLVTLLPGSPDDGIECSIQEATLDPAPSVSYDALSYLCGSFTKPEDTIQLKGETFRVTRNLAEALRNLRHRNQEIILWVDALCINPADDNERDAQISLMGPIYKNAQNVVAFLGTHDEFHFLNRLEPYDDKESALLELLVSYSTLKSLRVCMFGSVHLKSHEGPDDIHILARRVEWNPRFDQLGSLEAPLPTIGFLDGLLDSQCLEPSDHIYAFCHLLAPDIQSDIDINVQKRPEEIICQASQAIIKNTQNLSIITIRGRQAYPLEQWQFDLLPSWCPFFGVPYLNKPLPSEDYTRRYGTEEIAIFSADGKIMHTKGLILGKINSVTDHKHFVSQSFKDIEWVNKARVDSERNYACKCIALIEAQAGKGADLYSTVLWNVLDREFGLLECLQEMAELTAKQQSQLNKFAEYFHSRQLCFFTYDDDPIFRESAAAQSLPDGIPFDFAIIPGRACVGDLLCAILGCEQLVVLRAQGKHYQVIGEAKVVDRTDHDILYYFGPSKYRSFALL